MTQRLATCRAGHNKAQGPRVMLSYPFGDAAARKWDFLARQPIAAMMRAPISVRFGMGILNFESLWGRLRGFA